jgi:hypothetical protein
MLQKIIDMARELNREFWHQFNFNCLVQSLILIAGALALAVVFLAGRAT